MNKKQSSQHHSHKPGECVMDGNKLMTLSCPQPLLLYPFLYPQQCAVSVEFSTGYWLSGPPIVALPALEAIYSSLINIW